ncbi:acyl-CoA dehydrogenase family protein [Nocardioides marmoriginsengisoli]|uniref:acyl-CoA dehydrogenase family protein n=1 Tax=Nocardioides marmoriginsengisoli TaxID=661483 RepID=UPI001C82A64D|nr:acyl-CoA dehydrogenase family protein [Nocardioides marmoriginsengisoli]
MTDVLAAGPTVAEFAEQARAFLDEHAEHRPDGFPDAMFAQFREMDDVEAWEQSCRQWQRTLFEHGFAGITWPAEVGGRGLSPAHALAWTDLEFEYDVPRGLFGVTLEMIGPTVYTFGTAAQKEHCRRILRGEEVWCQLMSEPGAGSDLAAVSTSARRTEDGWVVNGQKVWTSEARHSRYGYLIARSEPGSERHRGLTAFVVDLEAPGVEVRPLRQMTGGASFAEVFFDDVLLPAEAVLGEVGQGWMVAMTTLGFERFTMFGRSFGRLVRQAADLDWDASDARERFVDVVVQQRGLAAFEEGMHARLLAGSAPGPEAALAKLATGRLVSGLGDAVRRSLGAELALDDPSLDDWRLVLLAGPAFHIAGGTDEIVKSMIAERVLGLPKG